MNTEYTSFEPPEDETACAAPERSRPFHWWPPGFLGEDELEPLFSASSCEDAETEEDTDSAPEEDQNDSLADRLAHAFQIIDKQVKQINKLTEELNQLKEAHHQARKAVDAVKRRYRRGLQCVIGGLGLAGVLVFHREISQVGWNAFLQITDVLCIAPEDAIGFLTALAAVLLFWQLAKWTYQAAVDEFFGKDGDPHDLGDW